MAREKEHKIDARPITHCGCGPRIKVHIDPGVGRWFVEFISDNHNHEMVGSRFRGMMISHCAEKLGFVCRLSSVPLQTTLGGLRKEGHVQCNREAKKGRRK
ncbi:hypothetical protein PIB30_031873 [Stylosanthes scabra]|uniref:Protein FAR1-RELATED SEQUENCE n=1 Tax=Stylosanthes scabra TaxID=79078 RepID=A0ABU6VE29_9FABA|nr:hypothetical protein [Stylosanthes scabra]